MNTDKEAKASKSSKTVLIIGIVLILVAVAAIAICIHIMNGGNDNTEPVGNLVIDESNLEDAASTLDQMVQDGMFEVKMNSTWHFPDGKSASSNAYLANVANNNAPIYFEVILDDGTVAYKSTVIPVGSQIKTIKLDKALANGSYSAVCQYHLLNDDGSEISSFGVNIDLEIGQ